MESDSDSPHAGPDAPVVFIADASAEAERLAGALRARGYAVVDVPLSLLANRMAVQRPALVLCDADAGGAFDVIAGVRGGKVDPPPFVLVTGRAEDLLVSEPARAASAAVFVRPVSVADLVQTVERLAGPASRTPLSVRTPRQHLPSRPPQSRGPPSDRTPSLRAPVGIPPDLTNDEPPRKDVAGAPTLVVAPDIQAMLDAAERRLAETLAAAPPTTPAAAEDLRDAPVPPDALAALDEPLDDEDDGSLSSPGGTGAGTGAGNASGHGRRGQTSSGRTSLGTDRPGRPPSDRSEPMSAAARSEVTNVGGTAEVRDPDAVEDVARLARQQASTPKPPRPPDGRPVEGQDWPSAAPPDRQSSPPETTTGADFRRPSTPPEAVSSGRIPPSLPAPVAGPEPAPTGMTVFPGRDRNVPPPTERRPPASSAPGSPRSLDMEPQSTGLTSAEPVPSVAHPTRAPQPSVGGFTRVDPVPEPRRASEPPPTGGAIDVAGPLRAGDAVRVLASAIRSRLTGALALEVDEGIRRIVFRDGDLVMAASGVHGESLVAFLLARGDIPQDAARHAHKLPAYGRRAGAALIAHGLLVQDQLWPVLRSHAEWIVGKVVRIERGAASVEQDVPGRLQDEPAVFGGAAGAEVLVEILRRVEPPAEATVHLGGDAVVLGSGPGMGILGECALPPAEVEVVQQAPGRTVREIVVAAGDPSFAAVLHALAALGVLVPEAARPRAASRAGAEPPPRDSIDDDALRGHVLARKALVDEGDYFALLGVAPDATGYDIRRAYTTLRRDLEPSRVLTSRTADLRDVVDEIVEVLDEAYEILRDDQRRARYRRAIQATP